MTRRGRRLAGVLVMAVPAGAAAIAAGQALADAAPAPIPVAAHLQASHVAFGRPVVVSGRLPRAAAGARLELQYLSAGALTWEDVARGTAARDGRYRITARLRSSGFVRVVTDSSSAAPASPTIALATDETATNPAHVAVAAGLRVHLHQPGGPTSRAVRVDGDLLPALAGRIVYLQAAAGRHWRNVAAVKTGRGGRFTLRTNLAGASEQLRVRFGGDLQNAPVTATAGTAASFTPTLVSWYDDQTGQTACGFHAYYGVANKTLPCGTQVTFQNSGHTVTATVDDRGPYVGGRQFDLNQNTAAALGFSGVGDVWAAF